MKERAGEERKEEQKKLETIMERHKALIPRIQETLIKTECYWKCYSYGDDLLPIFEFIDDLRNRSVKEVRRALDFNGLWGCRTPSRSKAGCVTAFDALAVPIP